MADVERQRDGNGKMLGGITGKGFMPGKSGNPKGPRVGQRSITAIVRRMLDEGLDGEDIAEALAKTALNRAKAGDLGFWKEVVERTDGKTSEPLDDLAQRIASDLRNRPEVAPAPPSGAIQTGDGPAEIQAGPGGAADGQDDDKQAEAEGSGI